MARGKNLNLFQLSSAGSHVKQFRKMVHSLLNITTSKQYLPYQVLENRQMLFQFLKEPKEFLNHIRRYEYLGAIPKWDLSQFTDRIGFEI